jgi:hypothetical protein
MGTRQIGNDSGNGLLLVSILDLVKMKRYNVSKLLGCFAGHFVILISSKRECKGEMVSTTPARITPTVSLTADFPPPVGQMSNNGAQELSLAKAIM